MQDKAIAAGLGVTPVEVGAKNYLGASTDSYAEFLKGVYARRNPRYLRPVGTTRFGKEVVDDSVQRRRREIASYSPKNSGLPDMDA